MPKKSTDIAKLSNAFSTGSGGANFERHVQAIFVLSLIIDGFTPIIDVPVKRLDFQAKHQGYDVDDLLVVGSNSVRQVKLLCQIKHSLSVTNSDRTFQEVITAAWSDFNKPSFNQDYDRIALITGFIAKDSINALRYIHDQAIAASNEAAFIQRMNMANYTISTCSNKFNAIKACITKTNSNTITDVEIWKFCRCFVLAVFDVDYKCSVNRILASSLIHCKSAQDASLVWSRLSDQCGIWNQQAATVTASNMPYDILELFNCNKLIPPTNSASINFPSSDIWSKITLIGCWDERNENDIKAIEELTQMKYGEFQGYCRELLISNPQLLTFKNGIWKSLNRKTAFENIREFYFDETIDRAFQITATYLTEITKQINEYGQFDIVIPDNGRFNNSDSFRSALLTGLCMLANGPQLVHCSDNIFTTKSTS